MGVSLFEGSKAERVAVALETLASSSTAVERAEEAARQAQEAASDVAETMAEIETLSDNIETLTDLLTGVTPDKIGAVSFNDPQDLNATQQRQARANIGLDDIDSLTTGNVKYNTAQELTTEEKIQARSNIDAISAEDVSQAVTGVVKYTEQVLDPSQQAQARENIGAISGDEVDSLVTGVVKYTEQALTPVQQEQARENIGAIASDEVSELITGVVKYDELQSLTPGDKERARTNIDAADTSTVGTISSNLSTVTTAVNTIQNSINVGGFVKSVSAEGSDLQVTYSNNEQDIISIGSGIADVEYDSAYYLHFYNEAGEEMFDGPFFIQGGGGGAAGYSVQIKNGLPSTTLTVASTQTVELKFTYREFYGEEEQDENGFMTVQYKLSTSNDWITYITNRQIPEGVMQSLNVTELLTEGSTTNIRIICSNGRQGDDAVTKTIQYNVSSVAMNISTTFNSDATYTGNLSIPYLCVGRNISKIVYLEIDGVEYTHVNIGTSHNVSLQLAVNMTDNYAYGAHFARMWFETEDGTKSNILQFNIIYDDSSSTDPIVASLLGIIERDTTETVTFKPLENGEIENGETLGIRYTVYTPGQETTDSLRVRVYAIEEEEEKEYYNAELTDIRNNEYQLLPITSYPAEGNAFVELISGATSKTLPFTVTEIQTDYDINPVTSGLVYSYRPVGYTNSAAGKETYTYELTDAVGNKRNIKSQMDNFNWVTDGYLDSESLTLNGEAKMSIHFPILTTSFINDDGENVVLDAATGATVTTSGRTVEFEFKLSNVTNQNTPVITYMSNEGVGFEITPQVCYLLSDGQTVRTDSTGFIENEESIPCAYIKDDKRIRVSFVIQRKRYTTDSYGTRFISYANIFINGEYANSFLYSEDASYNGSSYITIGSTDCVTNLYDVRIYNRDLDRSEILQNRMNSDTDIRKRIAQNEFNDVLDSDGEVDYNKAKYKYPCLLFIGPLSNYKADKKNVGVVLTKPDGLGSYTTELSLLDKDAAGKFVSNIKVQGTSSQRFMRKNFKVGLVKNKGDGSGTQKVKYVLKGYDDQGEPLSIGESTLCFKMDYMSTDHANTFNANIADTLFNDKEPGSLIQNTIWGFRCLLFNLSLEDYIEGASFDDYDEGKIQFAGDGCLNNDKSNTSSFGLSDPDDDGNDTLQQKWEFKDNSQALCSFKTDRLFEMQYDAEGHETGYIVKLGLESCYPDEGDLEDEGLDPDYSHIQVLFSWVYQRANFWEASTNPGTGGEYNGATYDTERDLKKAIFKREFTKHFNMEHALVYYIFIEWVALCDNRAKNMFLSCKNVKNENLVFTDGSTSIWDCVNMTTGEVDISKIDWENSTFGVWYCDLYDLDSCFGAENSGYLRIPYYADWNYQLNGNYQFNGHDSRLWCMFEETFDSDIKSRAQQIVRTNTGYGALNYNVLKQVHITENAELVCPAIVNKDMEYKYEDAWTKGYWDYSVDSDNPIWTITNAYKYLQRGSRTEQKESFIYRRSNMLYSKYQCDPFLNDQLNFRCGQAVNKADTTLKLSAVQAMWMGVTYGDSGSPQMSIKKPAGEEVTIISPNNMGRSDNVHIHGASSLVSVSSLANFHPYEIGLTNAGKLKTLLIGSNAEGYENSNLSSLDTSACTLLDTLNVQNCTGFTDSPINLSSNTLIREVYAGGSTVPYFTFANGGILETLELGTPRRIIVQNQPYLDNFSYDSLNNLVALRVENTPGVKVLDILKERLANLRLGIRLIDIDETILNNDRTIFALLTSSAAQGKRMDANGNLDGNPDAYPVITGTIHCSLIGQKELELMNTYYPNLVIDVDPSSILPQYTITFYNADGTKIKDKYNENYVQYIDQGATAYDPVEAGEVNTPTLAPTAQYTYTFSGWDNIAGQVLADKDVTAAYTPTTRVYTVKWYRGNGDLLKTAQAEYGTEVLYNEDETVFPTKTDQESSYIYNVFGGWDKSTGYVSEDLDVYAIWNKGSLPEIGTKRLDEMTPPQIYGVAKTNNAPNYWEPEDYIDIQVGRDFNFTNVPSSKVMENQYFTGNNFIISDEQLFDSESKAFTLAIDYEFNTTSNEATLAACYDSSGAEGFRLCYRNGYPTVIWGDKTATVGTYGAKRGMLVLMHNAGSKSLYVVSNNVGVNGYNPDLFETEVIRSQNTLTDAHLVFGGTSSTGGVVAYSAKGTVHWCKVWYANLGRTAIKQLANWTHETWRMKYIEANRYYPSDGTGYPTGATFIANASLEYGFPMDTSTGWDETGLFTFVNGRCLKALPVEWQQIIRNVNLPTTKFPTVNTSNPTYVPCRVHIPAYADVTTNTSYSTYNYAHEGTLIPWITNASKRIWFSGLIIPENAQYITSATDPSASSVMYQVKEGDVWIHSNNSNMGYIYVSAATAAKHMYLGSRLVSSPDNIVAADGGLWVLCTQTWTRTRYPSSEYYYQTVTQYGSTTMEYATNYFAVLLMFSL